jgi:hypothetical protein
MRNLGSSFRVPHITTVWHSVPFFGPAISRVKVPYDSHKPIPLMG